MAVARHLIRIGGHMIVDEGTFWEAVISFLLVAGTGLAGFRLRLKYRQTAMAEEAMLAALRQEHAEFRAELISHLAELEDRVDFAERRLLQERSAPPEVNQARIPTPV